MFLNQINSVALSFIVFVLAMVFVGLLSSKEAKESSEDYLLAGRKVHPWVMALSMLSTNYSGFMFIAYIGYTYNQGISSIWWLITWALGDLLGWLTIHRKLREKSEARDVSTITSFVGTCDDKSRTSVIKLVSVISFIFLSLYAAAQLKVSSKALHVMLDWDYNFGIIIAGLIVAVYCFSGGIRASIWTDVIQSILMCGAMFLLFAVSIYNCGGFVELFSSLEKIDPHLVTWIPEEMKTYFLIFIISLLVNGYGVIGQPHTMVRPMSINDPAKMNKSRDIYFLLYVLFGLAALGVGLASRILMPEVASMDAELTLPLLASKYLPDVLVGFILAGIFSAAISTADSQIISCSASITQDLFPRYKSSYVVSKLATLAIAILAISFAIFSKQNVFDLTIIAWAVLAAAIGPLMVIRCFDWHLGTKTSILMVIAATFAVVAWRFWFHLQNTVHEVLPGVLVAVVIYALSRTIKKVAQT